MEDRLEQLLVSEIDFFNKLFDKTPSELALEFTGISKLWKDEKSSEKNKEIVKNTSEQKKS